MVMRGGRVQEAGGTAIGEHGSGPGGVTSRWSWEEQGLRWAAVQAQDPSSIILSISSGRAEALLETWQNDGVGRMVVIYLTSKVAGGTDGICFIFRVVGRADIRHTELCEWMASKGSGQMWI